MLRHLVDALATGVYEVLKAIDSQYTWFMLEQMEIAEELNQTLIVLNVLELYLPQSFDAYFTINSKNHFGLDHFFLGCYEAGVGRGVGHLNFTGCPLNN